MTIVGGLRARLVKESLHNMVKDSLTALDWFDSGRQHLPINMIGKPVAELEEIPFNTLVVTDESMIPFEQELGSNLMENRWQFFIDFYAENDAIGLHLIRDLQDALLGKMPSIGRTMPVFTVYDYTQATPPAIAICQLENIVVDRAHNFPNAWQKHWYAVAFDVVDIYMDET